MKTTIKMMLASLFFVLSQATVQAEIIGGINWADEVISWTGNVQNYGMESMTEDTTWWITGAPDCDPNGDGLCDLDNTATPEPDYLAGWRNCGFTVAETITLKFNTPIQNGEGDDLKVVSFGGGGKVAVLGSQDNETYSLLGYIEDAYGPGIMQENWYDLSNNYSTLGSLQYVQLARMMFGGGTGRFFDAVGGKVAVPEPTSFVLLLTLLGSFLCRHRKHG